MSSPEPAKSKAVSAGRGLVYITAAKLWFMVGAAGINFALPWLLKSRERYGEWSNVLSVVSALNNVMVTATIQSVSKFASRGPEYVEGTKRAALRMQLLVGGGAALLYFLAAPAIAQAERDPGMVGALRLSSGVVLAYAFYAVFVGATNGAREFHKQAGLDASFTTLRAILVCGAAAGFTSVTAAIGGFVAAAATILAASVIVVGVHPVEKRPAERELFRFMLPVATYLFIQNCLMFVDGWVLKPVVAAAAAEAGRANPADIANAAVGIYGAAQNVARLPYQAIVAVTFIIFPLISQSTFAADAARTRGYVEKSLRWSFLAVMAMAAALAARPDAILSFFPRGEYLPGGPALATLVFGYVAFSLLAIAGTIINSSGRTTAPTAIAAITLVADATLVWLAVRFAVATGRDPLVWAAGGTTSAMALGVALSLGYLRRHFAAGLGGATIARTVAATAVALAVGRVTPLAGKAALGGCALAGLAFVAVLFLTRELTLAELRALRGRRAP